MFRCARCMSSSPAAGHMSCPSCNWRSTRRGLRNVPEAGLDAANWQAFYRRVQGPKDALRGIRLFAMLVGEDGRIAEERAGAALSSGDVELYRAELLRLTDKLLDRIHEF